MARTENTTPATTRPRKSRAEKAVAELDAAIKSRDTAEKKLNKLKEGVQPAQAAFDEANALVNFLQQSPLLPEGRRVVPQPAATPESTDEPSNESADNPEG